MKVTKKQLKRLIREMYPAEGVTLERLEQLTVAHENLMSDVEEMYEELGIHPGHQTDVIRDIFTELLFPLFQHTESKVGVPGR